MMIKTILMPLDGSELSRSVLPVVEELAQKLGASLVLFHAVSPIVGTFPGTEMLVTDGRLLEEQKRAAQEFLGRTASEVAARGIEATSLVTIGSVVDAIVEAAREQGADMIAMSTHGHAGIGRWMLGSVAERTVRLSPIPVLTVRV